MNDRFFNGGVAFFRTTAMLIKHHHNSVTINFQRARYPRLFRAVALSCSWLLTCNGTALANETQPDAGRFVRFFPLAIAAATVTPNTIQNSVCVRDTRTELIWEVKGREPGLQYRHNTYSWLQHDGSDNGGFAGYTNGGQCSGSPCDTEGYVRTINQHRLCGLSHWRLPSRRELAGLIDYRIFYPEPVLDPRAFPQAVAQFYWSSNPDANDKDSAWGIGFAFGYDYAYFKSDAARVRLVHDPVAGKNSVANSPPAAPRDDGARHCRNSIKTTAPATRFVDHGRGTIVDSETGLMWARCVLGQDWQNTTCTGKAHTVDLRQAFAAAAASRLGGYTDWRLPDIAELESIIELRCENPALNLGVFPDASAADVWSTTAFANNPHMQWLVQLRYGERFTDQDTANAQVRLVRRYRIRISEE